MYQVMDDMVRLEYIGEMDLYAYTDEDIDYMKKLLANDRELISEGAAFTLYTSCKYLIVKLTAYYQKYCTENLKVDIPKEVRKDTSGSSYKISRRRYRRIYKRKTQRFI